MSKRFGKLKILVGALAALIAGTTICVTIALADPTDDIYLAAIQADTDAMLVVINQLPTYLTQIAKMAATMLASDSSSNDPVNWSTYWTNEQTWLTSISSDYVNNEAAQASMQQSLLTNFFGSANITAGIPQNLNDLSYPTLLGQPLLSPDPRSGVNAPLNYITNASGLSVKLTVPGVGWRGKATDQQNYSAFYNTVTSIQTFNAYILGRLYQDSQTHSNDSSMRSQLITQSTNASWFTSVATNDLGWVLRQILLFNSQTYVLMDQILQCNKQITASLAMTNALLVANTLFVSPGLVQKAQGSS